MWEVRENFFEIEMTKAYLYVYRTEKIEGKFGNTGEETTSELISLSEEWMWSIANGMVILDGHTDFVQGRKAECIGW